MIKSRSGFFSSNWRSRLLAWIPALILPVSAQAQFMLEDFAGTNCGEAESVFRSGLEPAETTAWPSGGSDPATGYFSLDVFVPDTGLVHPLRVSVPTQYTPQQAHPLLIALHGAAGSAAAAPAAAESVRQLWQAQAQAAGAIVLAPVASGSLGGWVPVRDTPALACAIALLERRFNIDRSRRYLWGFSAGAHYGHALALGNAGRFAAYAANAGALLALACGPVGSATDCAVTLPLAARRIPVLLRVGNADPLLAHTQDDFARLQGAGWTPVNELDLTLFNGGHQVGNPDAAAAWAWFAPRHLP